MDSGYYAACTALVARTQALDAIANNLANVSTVGYRGERTEFRSVLADAGDASGSDLQRAENSYGIMGDVALDLSQGNLQKTGNELDMAIQGSGYFVVQTARGPMYTRNGSFQVSAKRELVTPSGDPVMGEGGVITLQPGSISVAPDGTISSNGAITGRLHIVEFPPSTKLSSAGNNLYSAPANTAVDSPGSSVQQGFLESSNVNPILGMVELVTAQRDAETMQRALAMFNNEMDKTATQDLPKVS
jgi:flagellar basal-body rod protein FlgF